MRPFTFQFWALIFVIGFAFGCDGTLNADTEFTEHGGEADETPQPPLDPTDPFDPTDPVDPDVCAEQERIVQNVPTRVMTSNELNNALNALFDGLEFEPVSMTYDSRVGSFVLNARESVSPAHIRDFRTVAETIAADAAQEAQTFAPCDDASSKEAAMDCAGAFIDDFGSKAFRRPLQPEERTGLLGLFETGFDEAGYGEGMKYVFEATLQAPSFVYVHEDAQSNEASNFEIAQRMAAMLWQSIPDDRLMNRARAQELTDPDVRREEASRMLEDPRADAALRTVVIQWIGVDRLEAQAFAQQEENAALVQSMLGETQAFVDGVMQSSGSYQDLIGARYTLVDERMADHYGIDTTSLEAENGLYRVDTTERAGILTHASFLALQHGPVHRGLAIRKAVLCGLVPGPVGVDTESIPTEPGESERSKSEKRLATQSCGGCHQMMDPLGLPFETFGYLGESRIEDDYGNAVSTTGEVFATTDADGPVSNAVELVERLSQSEDVRTCVATHLFTWSYARVPSQADACLVQDVSTTLEATGGDLRAAMISIIADESFWKRQGVTQ